MKLQRPHPQSKPAQPPAKPVGKRILNEAAHKVNIPRDTQPRAREVVPSQSILALLADNERDVQPHGRRAMLALGALGVVFGDLGTSPLYTEQTIFTQHADVVHATPAGVYGTASLVFWSLIIIASVKYAGVIMRAHNQGDGGVMALTGLIRRLHVPRAAGLVTLGLLGAGLFLGDGMITPAITVTSAMEGLKVATPGIAHLVVPLALAVLILLFVVQRFGTGTVGVLFGPVLLLWFLVIGILGAHEVILHPGVVQGLSPTWGIRFLFAHGVKAWLTLGAVVLCVTGAEALYADRGHFGATAIRVAWFAVVLPAVLLSYLGQGALILSDPHAAVNPFYLLVPGWGRLAMVFLATAASIIASQSVISGAFSVVRQAVQLGFLPRVQITHTSDVEGQIYVPLVNWVLCIGVVVLVAVFETSARLTSLYGMAVTGTFILDTTLFIAAARALWRTPKWKLGLLAALFLSVELAFFTANLTKIPSGAWIPLCVGLLVAMLMTVWRRGQESVTQNRVEREGSLTECLSGLPDAQPPIVRTSGTAIFPSPSKTTTPLALRLQIEEYGVFQERVLIVSLQTLAIPRVHTGERFLIEQLGKGRFKVTRLTIYLGYHDSQNLPELLALARKHGALERNFDLEHATYFLSRITLAPSQARGLRRFRNRLFIGLARNAGSPIEHFGLPASRTIMSGSQVSV